MNTEEQTAGRCARLLGAGDQETPADERARRKARLGTQLFFIHPKVEAFREFHHHKDFNDPALPPEGGSFRVCVPTNG
jgi:hypothetical protein